MNEMESMVCPCGSGSAFDLCCGCYINDNQRVSSAEKLMRSRYTAYTLKDEAYLLKTWHQNTQPATLELDADMPDEWNGLEIVRVEAGLTTDKTGVVEFIAYFSANGKPGQIREISEFLQEDGVWYYVDGEIPATTLAVSDKVGRNAPCPCGSGKKYKHCCRI